MINLIAQVIGFIALIISFIVFQKNYRKKMLYLQMTSALLYSIHFILLGALTGSAMNFVNIFRNYIFAQRTEKEWANKKVWLYVFSIIFIFSGLLIWESYYSILPIIGMVSGTIGFWMKNPTHIRLISLISPPCWFIYNFISGSYPGMITEIFLMSSVLIGILRFDILKNNSLVKCK